VTSRVEAISISAAASTAWYTGARAERLAVRMAQVFLLSWVLFYLVNGLKAAFWFDGYPVNGPFQLYDPLRRLAAGQHAGTDFQFFHGIGVPFLHYPLFRLFGGDSLQASELSRQFTSYLLFVATLAAFVWATFRRSATRWIAFAAGVLAIEAAFHRAAEPGHSFISGRSAMPIFAFAVLQLRVSNMVKGLLSGLCIAGAFLFGTEHGISLTLGLIAVTGISVVQGLLSRPFGFQGIFENVKFLALTGVTALVGTAGLFVAFCGTSGALKAIRYNLVELPGDQFWFFSSPPMPYLKDLRELVLDHHVILCFLPTYVMLAGLVLLIALCWKKPLRLGTDWQALAAVMLTYAGLTAIPLIGILSRHYVFPQMRIAVLVVLLLLANVPFAHMTFKPRLPQWSGLAFPALFTVVCGVVGLMLVYQSAATASALSSHVREPAAYSKYLDSHWNGYMAQMTHAIDSNRKRDRLSLWSEYAAMLDAHYGTFQPGEDYIIHTVGQERWHHYLDTFQKTDPEFVTTMNSQFSFAEWLQDERWEFYEELLNNYRPVAQIEHATLWQRQAGAWVNPAQDFQVLPFNADGQTVVLPAARTTDEIVVVRIHYTVANPWCKLPLIGTTPRYLVEVEGTPRDMAISVPPYVTEFQFPVKVPVGKTLTLHFKTDSFLPGASVHANDVSVKPLAAQAATDALFARRIVPSRY
jgi:hypothetical protein